MVDETIITKVEATTQATNTENNNNITVNNPYHLNASDSPGIKLTPLFMEEVFNMEKVDPYSTFYQEGT